jgi:hypothetical protein
MRSDFKLRWLLGYAAIMITGLGASAATITVNSTSDSLGGLTPCESRLGTCTLRGAITRANSIAGDDTIRFSVGAGDQGCDGDGNCLITLSSALPNVTGNLSIEGPSAGKLLSIARNNAAGTPDFRILTIKPGLKIEIGHVTISNGRSNNGGGGIFNEGSHLTVRNCFLSGNVSTYGGAIWNASGANGEQAQLTLLNSTLILNIAQQFNQVDQVEGGGILNSSGSGAAILTVTNCVFNGNSGGSAGGAISNATFGPTAPASIDITDCTFRNNHADNGGAIVNRGTAGQAEVNASVKNSTFSGNNASADHGGAFDNIGSVVALVNCTLSGNTAFQGGGVSNRFASTLFLTNCTFSANISSDNSAGLSVRNVDASVHVTNTIFDRTINFPNIFNDVSGRQTFHSLGHNIVDDAAGGSPIGTGPGGLFNASGDQRNTDAALSPLANNGGPTETHAFTGKGPADNAGDDLRAPALDQRGFVRSGVSDVGAYELGGLARPILANISTRLRVETGDNALIAGFIVTGTQDKKVIVRGIGTSLPFSDKLANPTLELRDSANGVLSSNDDWVNSANKQAIIDSTIPPANDLESAILSTLRAESSSYTAVLRGASNGTGIGVVEVYDLDTSVNSRLANISTRGLVGTDDNVLIAGTILLGQPAQKVIVRAIGPSLPITGALANPTLELRDGNGALVRGNDDWRIGGQESDILATTIPPSNDLESAVVESLPANGANYTAIVRGSGNTTGLAVVEIYRLE